MQILKTHSLPLEKKNLNTELFLIFNLPAAKNTIFTTFSSQEQLFDMVIKSVKNDYKFDWHWSYVIHMIVYTNQQTLSLSNVISY